MASMMTKMATPVCQASICTLNGSECALYLVEKNSMYPLILYTGSYVQCWRHLKSNFAYFFIRGINITFETFSPKHFFANDTYVYTLNRPPHLARALAATYRSHRSQQQEYGTHKTNNKYLNNTIPSTLAPSLCVTTTPRARSRNNIMTNPKQSQQRAASGKSTGEHCTATFLFPITL